MSIGATVVDANSYGFTCCWIEDKQPGPKGQGRMCCGGAVPIESLSACRCTTMKAVTVAVVGSHGALLVDCLRWVE